MSLCFYKAELILLTIKADSKLAALTKWLPHSGLTETSDTTLAPLPLAMYRPMWCISSCGWAMASSKVLATDIGRSKVAQPPEYTITSSNGERKPRFLADNVEHTKSNTHMSVQIPTTKIFFI